MQHQRNFPSSSGGKTKTHSVSSSCGTTGQNEADISLYKDVGNCPHELLGMRALWRAVITQALMDASSNSSKVIDKVEGARARAWFSRNNPDFITVCSYADLDPSYVIEKSKEAIKRGCKWRQDSSKYTTGQRKKPGHAMKQKKEMLHPRGQAVHNISQKSHCS